MQTRQPGRLSIPGTPADHAWRTESSGAVYPVTPARALPGVWESDGVMVTPSHSPATGSVNDPSWTGSETGVITPEADYTITGAVDEIPTGTKNGTNKVFTLTSTPATGAPVTINLRESLLASGDYTISSTTLTLGSGVTAPASTDTFRIYYFTA